MEITGSLGQNNWYVGATVNVTLSATDSSSGVSSTAYRTNGGNWQSYSGEFQISQEGSFTVDFYSVDTAGNSESQKSASFKIDTSLPSLTLGQSNGTLFKSDSVTITWSCGDSISGLNRTEYSLDNSAYQACTGDSLTLTGVSDGTHTITLRGIDGAGNAVERTLSFRVDTNLFSLSGPMGPWMDVGLILVAVVIAALLFLLLGRRKAKPAPAKSEEAKKTQVD